MEPHFNPWCILYIIWITCNFHDLKKCSEVSTRMSFRKIKPIFTKFTRCYITSRLYSHSDLICFGASLLFSPKTWLNSNPNPLDWCIIIQILSSPWAVTLNSPSAEEVANGARGLRSFPTLSLWNWKHSGDRPAQSHNALHNLRVLSQCWNLTANQ